MKTRATLAVAFALTSVLALGSAYAGLKAAQRQRQAQLAPEKLDAKIGGKCDAELRPFIGLENSNFNLAAPPSKVCESKHAVPGPDAVGISQQLMTIAEPIHHETFVRLRDDFVGLMTDEMLPELENKSKALPRVMVLLRDGAQNKILADPLSRQLLDDAVATFQNGALQSAVDACWRDTFLRAKYQRQDLRITSCDQNVAASYRMPDNYRKELCSADGKLLPAWNPGELQRHLEESLGASPYLRVAADRIAERIAHAVKTNGKEKPPSLDQVLTKDFAREALTVGIERSLPAVERLKTKFTAVRARLKNVTAARGLLKSDLGHRYDGDASLTALDPEAAAALALYIETRDFGDRTNPTILAKHDATLSGIKLDGDTLKKVLAAGSCVFRNDAEITDRRIKAAAAKENLVIAAATLPAMFLDAPIALGIYAGTNALSLQKAFGPSADVCERRLQEYAVFGALSAEEAGSRDLAAKLELANRDIQSCLRSNLLAKGMAVAGTVSIGGIAAGKAGVMGAKVLESSGATVAATAVTAASRVASSLGNVTGAAMVSDSAIRSLPEIPVVCAGKGLFTPECGVALASVLNVVALSANKMDLVPVNNPQIREGVAVRGPSGAPAPAKLCNPRRVGKLAAAGAIATAVGCAPVDNSSTPHNDPGNWVRTFNDDFDGNVLDTSKWATTYSWGGRTNDPNAEQQWYIDDAFQVADGKIQILAKEGAPPEAICPLAEGGKCLYNSGIISNFKNFAQTYGYFEIRAKLPIGKGMWPTFWMVQSDGEWPPEIDVFEARGDKPFDVVMTLHWRDSAGVHQSKRDFFYNATFPYEMHTFAVKWSPESVTWFIDNKQVLEQKEHIPNKPMYLMANVAVGGSLPGSPDGTTPFPGVMEIDYIRAWQRADLAGQK